MNELKPDQLDDFFRKALKSPPTETPSERDWKLMERRLKPEAKQERLIPWTYWATGIAAALLIFFTLFFRSENSVTENQQAKNNQVQKQSEKQEDKNQTETTENLSIGTNELQNDNSEINRNKYAVISQKPSMPADPFISINKDPLQTKLNSSTDLSHSNAQEPESRISPDINNPAVIDNSTGTDPKTDAETASLSENKTAPTSSDKGDKKTSLQDQAGKWALSLAISPDLNSVKGFNKGDLGVSLGIGLSYKLAKSISVGTGVFYSQKTYHSDKTSYKATEKPFATWTSYSRKIVADCRVIDIPVNVNMIVKSGSHGKIIASAGMSSYIMLSEKYNFIYNSAPIYASTGREYTITNENKHILSVVNLAIGMEKPLSKQVSLVIQPYAKIPLTGIGQGETDLQSMGVGFQLNYSLKKQSLLKSNR